jgi:D-alanine-D-alanine ligase
MRVVVLHSELTEGVHRDEDDVLIQAGVVSRALSNLGYEPTLMPFSMDNKVMVERLRALAPSFVFNLVETVEGMGGLIYLAPAMLDHIAISYTGATTEAIFLTSNKIVAKRFLTNAGMPTPQWVSVENIKRGPRVNAGTYIIKSVWEHASIGLDDDAIVSVNNPEELLNELTTRKEKLGGECFAEIFVEGREFNLSLLAASRGPEVLPPAEIIFHDFPPEKPKVVGYTAKWEPDSFEYNHTPRHFDFSEEDAALIEELERIALNCWDLFALRGYARVDFRVDASGNPWVLEVNTNPCLSPDAGFVAAAEQAGLSFDQVIERIVADSQQGGNNHLAVQSKCKQTTKVTKAH